MPGTFKLDIDRLVRDEIEWELRARAITPEGTVDALRKCLRGVLALEKAGTKLHTSVTLDPIVELQECEKKLDEAVELVDSFVGTVGQGKKIETKFAHILNRLDKIVPTEENQILKRSATVVCLMELVGEYTSKLKSGIDGSTNANANVVVDANIIAGTSSGGGGHSVDPVLGKPDRVNASDANSDGGGSVDDVESVCTAPRASADLNKSVPVYKWNLKFSGSRGLSFNAFLERVEEMRKSRNVTKEQLFTSALDLFDGDALKWYNFVGKLANNWDDLVKLMKQQFFTQGNILWEQIQKRTQGPDEPIGIYIATMSNLFDRMPNKVPDDMRMQVLRTNIDPFYQKQLAMDLEDIRTPLELITLGRRCERAREGVSAFVPPIPGNLTCEPDLDYRPSGSRVDRTRGLSVREVTTRVPSVRTCWRCNKPNHIARDCRSRIIRCFKCNRPDVTKLTCPTCNPGNEQRRQ